MSKDLRERLQGEVLKIEKTGETRRDEEGNVWEKCVFTIKLTNFSKRTPGRELPKHLEGKVIKLVRWCCFDWHYKVGVKKTLTPEETEAVLKGEKTDTVYW